MAAIDGNIYALLLPGSPPYRTILDIYLIKVFKTVVYQRSTYHNLNHDIESNSILSSVLILFDDFSSQTRIVYRYSCCRVQHRLHDSE